MTQPIETLYTTIGRGIYQSLPANAWDITTFNVKIISRYMEASGDYFFGGKKNAGFNVEGMEVFDAFESLRAEMVKLNPEKGPWYSATFTLTSDGNFKFDFDYDHLPVFDVMPSPDKWKEEFTHFPQPELQATIQDWIDQKVEHDVVVRRLRELQSK